MSIHVQAAQLYECIPYIKALKSQILYVNNDVLSLTDEQMQLDLRISDTGLNCNIRADIFADTLRYGKSQGTWLLEMRDNMLHMRKDKLDIKLVTFAHHELAVIPTPSQHTLQSDRLVQCLKQALICTSTAQEANRIFKGVMLGDNLCCATNGFKLNVSQLQCDIKPVIIPVRSVQAIISLIDTTDTIQIDVRQDSIILAQKQWTLRCITIQGQFPNYQHLLALQGDKFTCNSKDLAELIAQADMMVRDNNIIKLEFSPETIVGSATHVNYGSYSNQIPCTGIATRTVHIKSDGMKQILDRNEQVDIYVGSVVLLVYPDCKYVIQSISIV